jgi:2',3'-cyclic-nucleotide 2'-phosphodiesterase / 3'-nucleotidase / 5'-nucleotidase
MTNPKGNVKLYIGTLIISMAALIGAAWGYRGINPREAEAAEKETVNLRIIGTTDIHGQLNSKDYELGVDYSNGGIARTIDLIKKTRNELPKENTITLDAGDTMYDYTTEYIFSEDQNEIQPIFKAMAKLGYDAITLGNHDFDYGYEYILKQLDGSGLRKITVVSHITDSKTGQYPFLENMLITRKLVTSTGKVVEVKVGIIGQTIPTLTSKTHSYAGILKTEDMVENAKIQAQKLKEMGADIVVALSHTGIGPENPELNFKNVAYALTTIPEIDVVVSGHEHNIYPTTDMTSPVFKLPNVDKKTYLINDKNLIMAGNRGKAIGVVDLNLEVTKNGVQIADRKSEIRMVTAQTTKEDKAIADSYGAWEDKLLQYSTDIIATLEKDAEIQNFYGLLGDNSAIQLLNDSKIDYTLRFVNTTGKSYRNYPIVAASTYGSYGLESVNDYVHINDSITESKLSSIQPYNNYIYIYTITGKQLKEWLEWTASAYETTLGDNGWKNGTMAELMKQKNLKSLINEDWLDDWSNFYIFDGIDYIVDPTREARYDLSGNQISSSRRVISMKYNGNEITDDMNLLIATNKITKPVDANKGVEKQVVLNGFIRTQAVLSRYLERISSGNDILPKLDYNWRVSFPEGYRFLVKMPNYAEDKFMKTPWYKEYLTEKDQYRYYVAAYPKELSDTTGPHIVAAPVITSTTASPYEVAVNVSDASEIKYVRYLNGDYNLDYGGFTSGRILNNNNFVVKENGIYTIYAEDIYGNKTIQKLVIDNFSDNLLGKPTAVTYTNRKTKITGTAEPGATIVFEAYTGTYTSKVNDNGGYSYSLPAQPSDTAVIIYVRDKRGVESEHISVPVKRTGPNQPSINPINNNAGYITGNTNDKDATVIAIIDDNAYVPERGGKELLEKNTEIFRKDLKIIPTAIDISEDGIYVMLLPAQEAGKTITVYNIDHISRNSRANSTVVDEVAPNAPVVYDISNIEKSISGYVPGSSNKSYKININIGDIIYETITDKYGRFQFEFKEQLYADQTLLIIASDVKDGTTRMSYPVEVKVKDIESYVRANSTSLVLNRVTNKSYLITGSYSDTGTVYLAIANGNGKDFINTLIKVETEEDGKIMYSLEGKLEVGSTIYAMTRFTDGKILMANKIVVVAGRPDTPSLFKEVTNSDKQVQVIANKDCEVILSIGTKTYVTKEYQYDAVNGIYIYTFTTDRDVTGTIITVKATNESGTSDEFKSKIVKVAPEQPKVNPVKAGDTVVTGKVELLDYTVPGQTGEVITPDRFKNAPAIVAKTQTRVFAQIGTKVYEGTIDKKGNFKITIPKQKTGTKISVWGSNKAGRGPLIKVIVVK